MDLDHAAVRLDELLGDGEAEAGAGGLRGVEGVEELLAGLGVDPGAVVAHAQPDLAPRQVLADGDLDARRGGPRGLERVEGVPDQVDHDAAQLLGVAAELALAVDLAHEEGAGAGGPLAEGLERGLDDLGHAHLGARRVLLASEAQEVRDRALDALELGQGDARVLDVLRRARVLLHLLHQALGGRDRVADLVGDAGGELLERARVPALELRALLRERGGDLLAHLGLEEAPAHPGLHQHAPELARETGPPAEAHDEPDRRQEDQERHHDECEAPALAGEAHLALGALSRLAQRALLGREEREVLLLRLRRERAGPALLTVPPLAPERPFVPLPSHRPASHRAAHGAYAAPRRGKVTTNSVPSPGSERSSMAPPWASTSLRVRASPMPVPPCFEV